MASIDDILASMRASAAASGQHSVSPLSTVVRTGGAANDGGDRQAPADESHDDDCSADSRLQPPPLDESHRVAGGHALNYRFRCATLRMTSAEAEILCSDCSVAFALNCSNWLGAAVEPRCALERLARAIFEQHTAGIEFDPARSGAEWWAQVRGGGHRHEGIEFHWDVDEHFCDGPGGGLHVHPHLSTVTYLTEVGAPTLGLRTRAPASATEEAVKEVHGEVASGFISWPRLGKHIVFDGSLLHGAVPCPGHGAPSGERRVTFLVNVWLGHQPHAVEPLPAQLARTMRARWDAAPAAFDQPLATAPKLRVELPVPVLQSGGGSGGSAHPDQCEWLNVAFGRNAKAHALKVLIPPRPSRTAAVESYRLIFGKGTAEVGANAGGLTVSGPKPPKTASGSAGSGKKKKKKRPRDP